MAAFLGAHSPDRKPKLTTRLSLSTSGHETSVVPDELVLPFASIEIRENRNGVVRWPAPLISSYISRRTVALRALVRTTEKQATPATLARPVDVAGLDGDGYGVTLTLRDTPASHEDWAALVARLHRAFRDAGLLRWHWVVEWQRRGTPHLHLAVYSPSGWESPISDIMSDSEDRGYGGGVRKEVSRDDP